MNASPPQVPEFGLVCITASDRVRFRTITRKRLLQFAIAEQEQLLRSLYTENLHRLHQAIAFCQENDIRLYRMNSSLLPFADAPVGEAVLPEFADTMQQIGNFAREANVRLVLHPDQFVVLSSDRPDVVQNSCKILGAHARMMDMLGLPRSPWALMNIHGGKGDRARQLIQVIRDLPDAIRLRLTLENDEYTYSTAELVELCRTANVPLVFDAHHHVIHEKVDSYNHPSVAEMLVAARSTWDIPAWQVVHISNGNQFFRDPQHSDYITLMPESYRYAPWIEVEAKQKEKAIARLRQEWLFHNTPLAIK
ncbi:MAG: UV DNA damage repair endonuclease UvsE [Oscillatoriales cyanobacterium C42_A2020_001]|nr:UV DNA damage repair endonuclease UvsE [Leptolyngbyaceae cyanobacterium C42_A2020_001]